MKPSRRSKYDPIYALEIGQHFDVPYDPNDTPLSADQNVNRSLKRTQIVPTSISNLRVVLHKHAHSMRYTGRPPKYKLEVLKAQGVIRVTRMPNDYTEPKQRLANGEIAPSTARNYEWLKARDAKITAAWEAAAKYKATGEKPTPEQLSLLRQARLTCESLAADAVFRLRTDDMFVLRRDTLRKIHGVPETAVKAVIDEARKQGVQIIAKEEVQRIGGNTSTVWVARSPASEERRAAQEARQLELIERELEHIADVPVGAVPKDRFARHVEYNYLWWNDFAWTNPRYHPLQPGERARVCFMRPMNTSATKPRIEDIERWVDMYNKRWAKAVLDNPGWGIEAPEYRLCGKFDVGGVNSRFEDVRGLERIARDPESGAIVDLILDWNMDDPFSMPVQPGKFQMVRVCTVDAAGNFYPCDDTRAVIQAVKGLTERTGVQLEQCVQQYGHGKGVYLIMRRNDDIDLDQLRIEQQAQQPQDNITTGVNVSDLLGD